MHNHLDGFRRRGVRVAAIAQGTGTEAERFCGPLEIGYPCLGDPDKQSYRSFGLGRADWFGMIVKPFVENPRLAWSRIRAADMKGATMPHSDVKQLGGVALIDSQRVVRYVHRAEHTDDIPAMSDVLAEIDRLGLALRPA